MIIRIVVIIRQVDRTVLQKLLFYSLPRIPDILCAPHACIADVPIALGLRHLHEQVVIVRCDPRRVLLDLQSGAAQQRRRRRRPGSGGQKRLFHFHSVAVSRVCRVRRSLMQGEPYEVRLGKVGVFRRPEALTDIARFERSNGAERPAVFSARLILNGRHLAVIAQVVLSRQVRRGTQPLLRRRLLLAVAVGVHPVFGYPCTVFVRVAALHIPDLRICIGSKSDRCALYREREDQNCVKEFLSPGCFHGVASSLLLWSVPIGSDRRSVRINTR